MEHDRDARRRRSALSQDLLRVLLRHGGTVRLFNGETSIDAVKGDFLYVPQGGIHAFSNESGAPARMLILFAPAPSREEYFQELAEIRSTGRAMTDEDWIDVWARHDQYPA